MPEEILETPQTRPEDGRPLDDTEPKSTNWLKVILAAVLGFGLLATSAYAGYYYGTQQVQPAEERTPTVSQPTTTPKPTATPTPNPRPAPLTESFQQILTKNCRKISIGASSFFHGIELDALPVVIDQEVVGVEFRADGTAVCAGDGPSKGTSYVHVDTRDGYNLNVYDENSVELGHGGPRFLGAHGSTIKKTSDVVLTVYMGWPDGGPVSVGEISVMVRGVKELQLSNGDAVFVNTYFVVIGKDDPRLLEVLDNYSVVSNLDPSRKEITASPGDVEAGVVARFFNNLTTLESPERENIRKLENILNAVTAR